MSYCHIFFMGARASDITLAGLRAACQADQAMS